MGIMADVVSILDELQNKALKDEKLKQQLLATRTEADPLSAFCRDLPESWLRISANGINCGRRRIPCRNEKKHQWRRGELADDRG